MWRRCLQWNGCCMCTFAALDSVVLLWFARQWLQIEVELLRHKVAPGVGMGNLVCATGAVFARLRSNASSIVKLNSGVQIAVEWLLHVMFEALVDVFLLWFARQWLQIEVESLRPGDVWRVEIAWNPVFSPTKWLPASMWGTSLVRRVRLCAGMSSDASALL